MSGDLGAEVVVRAAAATLSRYRNVELVLVGDEAELAYKCTEFYAPGDEGGGRWDDPDLAIPWPCRAPQVAARDAAFPLFRELDA